MRISTSFQYSNLELDVQQASSRLFDAQEQVSTGRRINRPSDDPIGVAKSLSLKSFKASIVGFDQNISTAKGILGFTDDAVSSLSDITKTAYQAALQGANSSTGQEARNALASQITELQSRLVALGNSRGPSGQYLFAGQKNDAPPYTVDATGLVYTGDNRNVVVPTDPTTTMIVSSPGEPMISNLYKQLDTLKNDLLGGNVGNLGDLDVAALTDAQTQLTQMRGQIGSKVQTLATLSAQNTQRKLDLSSGISEIEDADMSQAIVNFQQAQNAYQAALTVAGQGFKMSLMDFIST